MLQHSTAERGGKMYFDLSGALKRDHTPKKAQLAIFLQAILSKDLE